MNKNKETLKNLNDEFSEFIGSENYYLHWLGNNFVYTDGIKAMADKYGAYWLIDIPFSYQSNPSIAKEKFQIWTITSKNMKAVVEMRYTKEDNPIVTQTIQFTDFPDGELEIYYLNDGSYKILLLPSEY